MLTAKGPMVNDAPFSETRVLIAGSSKPERDRLRLALSHYRRIAVVGDAGEVAQLLPQVQSLAPQAVVATAELPGLVAAIGSLRRSTGIPVILISSASAKAARNMADLIAAGASGVVIRHDDDPSRADSLLARAVFEKVERLVRPRRPKTVPR